jgi:DNA-binding winged helix-turn-helix (wHTH) protein/tetratricopeptide (TPR) repeat protein
MSAAALGTAFRIGSWTVFPDECRIRNSGGDVHLRPQLMDVLVLLAAHAGTVVSKDDLLHQVWKRQFVSESSLTRAVAELRAHLGDTSSPPRLVETIPKRGYRLLAPVEPCGAISKPCVAVLPFEDLGGSAGDDCLAEGIADALITELGKVRSLRTISRQSVLHFRGARCAIADVARELGAGAIVTGTIQRTGARTRVSAQLVQAVPEEELWAESYESDRGDILALQHRLSAVIARAVALALVPAAVLPRPAGPQAPPAAWLAYARARTTFPAMTPEAFREGLACLRGAIDADPMFAPAYDELAATLVSMGFSGHAPPMQAYTDAEEAASIALGLDDSLSNGHAALALVRWLKDRDFVTCEAELRQAVALNPSNERARLVAALYHATVTRDRDRAVDHLRAALEADPVSPFTASIAAWIHLFLDDCDEATAQAKRAVALQPEVLHSHYVLAWVAARLGNWPASIAHMQDAVRVSRDPVSLAYLGHALARAGRHDEARRLLAEVRARQRTSYVPPFCFVVLHAGLGERDEAFEWLVRACADGESRIFWLPLTPAADPLRDDPRFEAFVQQLHQGLQAPGSGPQKDLPGS